MTNAPIAGKLTLTDVEVEVNNRGKEIFSRARGLKWLIHQLDRNPSARLSNGRISKEIGLNSLHVFREFTNGMLKRFKFNNPKCPSSWLILRIGLHIPQRKTFHNLLALATLLFFNCLEICFKVAALISNTSTGHVGVHLSIWFFNLADRIAILKFSNEF